jgi:large subunit ribosomal protein L3
MGVDKVTVRNLQVVSIDSEDNVLAVKGAVPGPNGGYVVIRKAVKPQRASRGFAGSQSVNPLKASKKAAGGSKKK